MFYHIETSGLYYKHVMIINDDSRVVSKWRFKLIDDARAIIYDRNMFIMQATGHQSLRQRTTYLTTHSNLYNKIVNFEIYNCKKIIGYDDLMRFFRLFTPSIFFTLPKLLWEHSWSKIKIFFFLSFCQTSFYNGLFLLLFLENYSRNLFKMMNIINMLLVFLLKFKLSSFELNVSKFWIMRVPLSSDIFMKTLHAQ